MPSSTSAQIKTPLARLSYPHLFRKHKAPGSTKEQYSCSLVFAPGTDLTALKNAAMDAAKAAWGEKAVKMIQDGIIKNPFLDGNGKAGRDSNGELKAGMGPGVVFIRCGSQHKPKVVDQKRLDADEEQVFAGLLVYAIVHAFTWDNPANRKGVSFGIDAVQIVKDDGTRFGGGGSVDVNSAFDEIPDEGPAPAAAAQGQGAAALFN